MRKRSLVRAMGGARTGRRTAGGKRRARSGSTAARSKSSGLSFVALTGWSGLCRTGRLRLRKDWLGKWPTVLSAVFPQVADDPD